MLEKIGEYLGKGYIKEEEVSKYLTKDQLDLIVKVCNEYEKESYEWASVNSPELVKWFDVNKYEDPVEAFFRFIHYCAIKFVEWKSMVSMEG